jgi:nitroimidazol reductase NimA-like FMN-containing flavoprotein (pyridoxamine 5'-phosphate oxidase superfamily)
MSLSMTQAEREAFLADVHVGIVTVPDGERAPVIAPIWYAYASGGELCFVTSRRSRKGRLLERGRRLSLCAQTEKPPYKYVTIEGAVVDLAPADVERDVRPIAHRYLGRERGDQYVAMTRDQYVGGENVLVRVRVERWLSVDYSKEYGSGA